MLRNAEVAEAHNLAHHWTMRALCIRTVAGWTIIRSRCQFTHQRDCRIDRWAA